MDGQIRLDQLAFLATLQLAVVDKSETLIAFGSAFILKHKGYSFLVTADHVVHLDDFAVTNSTGQRLGVDYIPQIITNNVDFSQLATINIPIRGFYYLDEFKLDKECVLNKDKTNYVLKKIVEGNIDIDDETLPIDVRIPNFPDIAVHKIIRDFEVQPISLEVVYDNEIIIESGTPKKYLMSSYVTNFISDKKYIVAGTVKNEIVDNIRLKRLNIIHGNLAFKEYDTSGYATLEIQDSFDIDYWSGLSGAPVFSEEGLLAGMLIRGPKECPNVMAVPISKIIKFIDTILLSES